MIFTYLADLIKMSLLVIKMAILFIFATLLVFFEQEHLFNRFYHKYFITR